MGLEGFRGTVSAVNSTPKPKAAHECFDFENKGNCEVDAAVIVVQEGEKTKQKMVDSVENMNAIRRYRQGLEDTDPTIDLGAMVGGIRELLRGNEFLFVGLTAILVGAAVVLLGRIRRHA